MTLLTNRIVGSWLDRVAIGASAACAVHCFALPLLIVLLPAWSVWLDVPETIHLWFLLAAAPLSGFALWPGRGCSSARRRPFRIAFSSLAVMALGVTILGHPLEPWVTCAGALLLAGAHLLNLRQNPHGHA